MRFTNQEYAGFLLPSVLLLLILAWHSPLIPAIFITFWALVAAYAGLKALIAALKD